MKFPFLKERIADVKKLPTSSRGSVPVKRLNSPPVKYDAPIAALHGYPAVNGREELGGDLAIRGDKVKMGAAVPAQRPISAREENKVPVNNHVRD